VRELVSGRVQAKVVARGHHDERAGSTWVIVRAAAGQEHYARLKFGETAPKIGPAVELVPGANGARFERPG
jgi:hypothetical protein